MEKGNKKGAKRAPPSTSTSNGGSTSWEHLAQWYDGWVGEEGSKHHRRLAIPTVLELLDLQPGEKVIDLGAGSGVLAPFVHATRAIYTGVDLSPSLLGYARRYHGSQGRFLAGDSRYLDRVIGPEGGSFDAGVFLLSIQDMNPLEEVLKSAAWALRTGGRLVILMTHPCFRVPRQSGWGWDEGRKLRFRRVDRYLTALAVPLKPYQGGKAGVSRSFHRPLEDYINGLGNCGLLVDCFREVPGYSLPQAKLDSKADQTAREEIPLFLGIRARKL
ncbi:MAG: class I SAM-dependent methyltransferase [Chloroflexi bacterium]|nr:class I SAM-dependent methyltransferase [Chloroflexota bacterium]